MRTDASGVGFTGVYIISVAARLLEALRHIADCDLATWKKTNLDEINRLHAEARPEFDRVVAACVSRAKQNETEEG